MQPAPDATLPIIVLLLMIPVLALSIVQLVCQIIVIVKMFQKDETGLGIACAILSVCTGIGGLIAFIYGWVKSSEWQLKKVMVIWTVCFALTMALALVAVAAMVGGAVVIPVNVEARP
jgi:hypothetical protein